MAAYFSATTGGFYDDNLSAFARLIERPDPAWTAPLIDVEIVADDGSTSTESRPDPNAVAPMIMVDNPDCRLPSDAKPITDARHAELMAAQAAGQMLVAGDDGLPVAVDRPGPTTADLWAAHKVKAQALLDASDVTLLRCFENAVAVPTTWSSYRKALRAIVAAPSGDPSAALPVRPAYPAGT